MCGVWGQVGSQVMCSEGGGYVIGALCSEWLHAPTQAHTPTKAACTHPGSHTYKGCTHPPRLTHLQRLHAGQFDPPDAGGLIHPPNTGSYHACSLTDASELI